jgi:hypothetical protein
MSHCIIKLSKNQIALVDHEDFDRLNIRSWYASKPRLNKSYYACSKISIGHSKKQHVFMHRVIMDARPGEIIDHVNHDTLDNRKSNLRKCTRSQNYGNMISVTNKTGYKGVHKISEGNFSAYLRNKIIGHFKTAEEAARAYNDRALKVYGEFALLNKVA